MLTKKMRQIRAVCEPAFKKLTSFGVYLLLTFSVGGVAMASEEIFDQDYPYITKDAEVQTVLADLGLRAGIVVRTDEAVTGRVTIDNQQGTIGDLLEETLSQVGATWWYDGMILYVEPQASLTTALVVSHGLRLPIIESELEALSLSDTRFPLKTTADGSVIRVVGPRGMVDQVAQLINILIETRRALTGTPQDTRLYSPRILRNSEPSTPLVDRPVASTSEQQPLTN
jgi:type III secretion protein C